MSLNKSRMTSLADQLEADEAEEALRKASEKEAEEAKIKASKKPSHNKLKD